MGAKSRNSHRATFDLCVCSRTGYHFRYAPEVKACEIQNPDSLITPYSRVRLSLPNTPTLHNCYGTVIGVEGPVVDKRFKIEQDEPGLVAVEDVFDPEEEDSEVAKKEEVEADSVMTYRVTVEVDGHGTINSLYSDQVCELSEQEIRNSMKGRTSASKKFVGRPSCVIGRVPIKSILAPEPGAEPLKKTASASAPRNNFERGFAEGLGQEDDDDDLDIDSLDLDDFDDEDSVDISV